MNMAYCRFHNTAIDLADCSDHMSDDDLSDEELAARDKLIELCHDIIAQAVGEPDEEYDE